MPTILSGVGLLGRGIALLRKKIASPDTVRGYRWSSPSLVPGVFVALLPGLLAPHVLGRLAIGGWMLLFAAVGWGPRLWPREPRQQEPGEAKHHTPYSPRELDGRRVGP